MHGQVFATHYSEKAACNGIPSNYIGITREQSIIFMFCESKIQENVTEASYTCSSLAALYYQSIHTNTSLVPRAYFFLLLSLFIQKE